MYCCCNVTNFKRCTDNSLVKSLMRIIFLLIKTNRKDTYFSGILSFFSKIGSFNFGFHQTYFTTKRLHFDLRLVKIILCYLSMTFRIVLYNKRRRNACNIQQLAITQSKRIDNWLPRGCGNIVP